MSASAFAGPFNRELLEREYARWQADPSAVDPSWLAFFAGMEFGGTEVGSTTPDDVRRQVGVVRLITSYRDLGHLAAHIDPLEEKEPPVPWLISFDRFHLTEADFPVTVDGSMLFGVNGPIPLGELYTALKETYCRTIGVEFMHLQDIPARKWLAERMEPSRNRPNLAVRQKLRTLLSLHWAELFEKYLHTKYIGQKRFSLEGAETLLPVLDAIVERGPSLGVKEYVIGMAHRGRLNVLANILRKPFAEIFTEFEDNYLPDETHDGDGDVKYHMGFSADVTTGDGGQVHLSLCPNPSHLEAVNPVVEGRVRAKQRLHNDTERTMGVPLLIHGDAAMAGQGLVAETFNLCNLPGYRTGGTLHVVINNQIGFTTSPRDARSTQYCTDVAKVVQAPIFHVNAEDPEACVMVAELALAFRQEFRRDAVIDLVCFRRWGHNEADEPSYTQPVEYKKIRAKPSASQVYTKQLVSDGTLSQEEADAIDGEFRGRLDAALADVKGGPPRKKGMKGYAGRWEGLAAKYSHAPANTAVPGATLDRIADRIATVVDGFTIHPKLKDILGQRRDAVKQRGAVDWGTGEALAFGSLVLDGHPVRLSGQDSRRGTFSHRHSFLYDYETGQPYCPLANLDPAQAPFDAYDSCLSEAAVLGFDYGYSLDDPSSLVLWEAQFGDFANGAQVIIDQFVASGESKWSRSSGLVLLLPHGYEGQGPEHSSARLERFLQMCAEDNMQVGNFTTPAQLFHALRRQVLRPFRKPLVVMTPKSLLRHPKAVSPIADFESGTFREVIDDAVADPDRTRRILICSGKVYYDLAARQEKKQAADIAVVRLEQFYPWPQDQLQTVLDRYKKAREFVWVQEESQNMGGWSFVEPRLRNMGAVAAYVGRDASASPATGSHHVHEYEQRVLVDEAFTSTGSYAVAAGKNGASRLSGIVVKK
ncbi:MAG TPA: 2-oxoglutarate dehydrogenase E1 component [Fimbriiglobus sp.]|jgi:2-oxoglutarate dehydrogenase E1 component